MTRQTEKEQLARATKALLTVELLIDQGLALSTMKAVIDNFKAYQLEQFLHEVNNTSNYSGTLTSKPHIPSTPYCSTVVAPGDYVTTSDGRLVASSILRFVGDDDDSKS